MKVDNSTGGAVPASPAQPAPSVRWAAASGGRRMTPPVHLTPRQMEVLALLCEGLPNKLICRRLNIATGTVKVHISCILKELGVASRLQAVVAARRCGLSGQFLTAVPAGATLAPGPDAPDAVPGDAGCGLTA